MPRLVAVGLVLVLVVYALIDCLQSPRREVRGLPKPAWVAVVLLVPLLGAVAWLVAGRPRSGPVAEPARPVAPDDDPDFLGRLRTLDEEHEELVRRSERERRRRDDREGRRGDDPAPEQGEEPRRDPLTGDGHDAPVDDGREPGA